MTQFFERGRSRSIRDDARLIDETCDKYERAWNNLQSPRIEDYLNGADGDVRTLLWLELVMVDQELRCKSGETTTIADYRERFPDEPILLDVSTAGGVADPEDRTLAAGASTAEPPASIADSNGDHTRPIDLYPVAGALVHRSPSPADGPPLIGPGSVLGDYVLDEKLGEGGMGVVYKARQSGLNRIVALKMIRNGAVADDRELRLFQREAEAVALLDHPNIVSILENGKQGDLVFYTMKLIAGQTLQKCLARYKNRPAEIARSLVKVAGAIQHAHERGVLHRDLKPSNILMDEEDEPHVIDFGLAKRLETDEASAASAQAAMGTPNYMAPEQALGLREQITIATDVYGLGTLLYSLLTGHAPFRGDSAHEMIRQVIEAEPRRPRAVNPGVPLDLETICLKCLEKEPQKRYKSARELGEDLERWLAGKPILARPVSTPEKFAKYARRHPWGSGMAGLLVLTAALGSGGIVWQWRQAVAARAGLQLAVRVAEHNEDLAKKSEDYARHLAYAATLNLAERDWKDANIYAVTRHLKDTLPPPEKTDLRGFEWYYLDRLCQSQGLTLAGHWDTVHSVAYSPDGRLLASASLDKTIKVWDAATGQTIRSIQTSDQDVYVVIFHPDGARLASAGTEGVVKLWDAATGQSIRTFKGHTGHVHELAISRDGKILASWSRDGTIKFWDVATGSLVRTLQDHKPSVNIGKIAFSPDGKTLVSAGGEERHVRVWDVAEGILARTLDHSVRASGTRTAPKAAVNDVAAGTKISAAETRTPVVFSPDGKTIACGADDGTIKFWDNQSRAPLRTFVDFHNRTPVADLAYSPDGKTLAAVRHTGQTISLWEVETGYLVRSITGHQSGIRGIAFSPDGLHVASASVDMTIKIWDTTRDQDAMTLMAKHLVRDVAFGRDGSYVLSASLDGSVTLWDLRSRTEVRTFVGHTGPVQSVTVSHDGRRAASAGEDESVRLWDVAIGKEIRALRGHTAAVRSISFSPDDRFLASASLDRTVKLWEVESGREVRTYDGHSQGVNAVLFSPDGKLLVSAGKDGFVLIRDVDSGRQFPVIKGVGGGVSALALSPDGRLLATGGYDCVVAIWDVSTGRNIHSLAGHAGVVADLAFAPDGRRLASAGGDQTVRIWDPAVGQELFVLRGHTMMVAAVAFAPDGRRIASAGGDGTIKLWEASAPPQNARDH
jgi:WD40 repeat protein/tRNA A-37 threonylcarbamoyl transferase component Bud32